MTEPMEWLAIAGLGGLLLGTIWGRWATWGYIQSKTPDATAHRTGFFLRGQMYYVVTEREYVNNVMEPLPDGSRVEIHDNFIRFTNMPKDKP